MSLHGGLNRRLLQQAVLAGSAEGHADVWWCKDPGGGGSRPLPAVLGAGGELGCCIATPSTAGQDGQTDSTDGRPGELRLQGLVEP